MQSMCVYVRPVTGQYFQLFFIPNFIFMNIVMVYYLPLHYYNPHALQFVCHAYRETETAGRNGNTIYKLLYVYNYCIRGTYIMTI